MKVVFFSQHLDVAGGAERLLIEELASFTRNGWDVRVACFSFDAQALYNQEWLEQYIDVLQGTSRIGELFALRRYFRREHFDLCIAHTHIGASYVLAASLGLGLPYITHIHGSLFWLDDDRLKYAMFNRKSFHLIRDSVLGHKEFIPEKWTPSLRQRLRNELFALVDQLAVRRSAAVITLTEQLQWELRHLYGVGARVVRGCLTDDQLIKRDPIASKRQLGLDGKKVVLSVGRLDHRKRVDVIVNAFALVAQRSDDVLLVIGGTGAQEAALRRLAGELRLEDRVRFVGFVQDDDLPAYYATSDVFVFPSWTSSGITPYEALAQGCKVVWTSEATEPVLAWSGVRVADPTPTAVAQAMTELLESPDTVSGDLAPFTWERFSDNVMNICSDVLAKQVN